VTVAPATSLKDVASTLGAHRISGVPVCDGAGHVLGVVSESDILRKERGSPGEAGHFGWLLGADGGASPAKAAARTASEAMTTPAVTIAPDRPLAEAVLLLVDRDVNRLPVVDAGRLVGILTRGDLVRAFNRPDAAIAREVEEDVLVRTLWIEPGRVAVSVEAGVVSLAGEVETLTEAELAAAYARRVPGVVAVDSRVRWRRDDLARRRSAPPALPTS
jgi:CBS domain-containing protein